MFKKKKIWFNLHLLLSFIFTLPILVLCITGFMLSYDSKIRVFFSERYSVPIIEDAQVLSVEELLSKFAEQEPKLEYTRIEISGTKGVPVRIGAEDTALTRFNAWEYIINPYTGEIITKNYAAKIMVSIRRIHVYFGIERNAWSPIGSELVGASTFVLMFLIISGIYLYFPNLKRRFISSFKIGFKAKGYKFLYNTHTALGLWLSITLTLMCFTGLYMNYRFVQDGVNSLVGLEKVNRTRGPSRFFDARTLNLVSTTDVNKTKEVAEAFELAKKAIDNDFSQMYIGMYLMHDKNRFYEFFYFDKNETEKIWQNRKTIVINMKNGRVMNTPERVQRDDSVFDRRKMRSIIKELHYGNFFGEPGRFVYFISCVLSVAFPITGFMMMFRRMKRKKSR